MTEYWVRLNYEWSTQIFPPDLTSSPDTSNGPLEPLYFKGVLILSIQFGAPATSDGNDSFVEWAFAQKGFRDPHGFTSTGIEYGFINTQVDDWYVDGSRPLQNLDDGPLIALNLHDDAEIRDKTFRDYPLDAGKGIAS